MAVREVHELRKAGMLDEAFQVAVSDLQANDTVWTNGALYWTLYDLAKTYVRQKSWERVGECIAIMDTLAPKITDDSGVASKALQELKIKATKTDKQMKLAVANSVLKDKIRIAYEIIRKLNKKGLLFPVLHDDAAWVLYRFIKHQVDNKEAREVTNAFDIYLSLSNERPSQVHQLMLSQAIELHRFCPDFAFNTFFERWDWTNFRQQDWKKTRSKMKTMAPSLAEQAIRHYCKYLVNHDVHEVRDDFVLLVKQALLRYPNAYTLIYSLAMVYRQRGDLAMAMQTLFSAAVKVNKAYAWHELARSLDDLPTRILALYKVVTLEQHDSYESEARLELAEALIDYNKPAEALREAETYYALRHAPGNKLLFDDARYGTIKARIPADTPLLDDNNALYTANENALNAVLYPMAKEYIMAASVIPQETANGTIVTFYPPTTDHKPITVSGDDLYRYTGDRKPRSFYAVKVDYLPGNEYKVLGVRKLSNVDGLTQYPTVHGLVTFVNVATRKYHITLDNAIRLVASFDLTPDYRPTVGNHVRVIKTELYNKAKDETDEQVVNVFRVKNDDNIKYYEPPKPEKPRNTKKYSLDLFTNDAREQKAAETSAETPVERPVETPANLAEDEI